MSPPDVQRRGPSATTILIAANVVVYLAMVARGDNGFTADAAGLLPWGANAGQLTRGGEWWRLLTACFLHGGIVHLLVNMVALRSGGPLLETLLGTRRYLALYLLAGVGASVGSVLARPNGLSVGASGAVFGVYGALLAVALRHTPRGQRWQALRPAFPRRGDEHALDYLDAQPDAGGEGRRWSIPPHVSHRLAAEIVAVFLLNLLIGLLIPVVDNAAHVAGFVCGVALGWIGADVTARHAPGAREQDGRAATAGDRSRWLVPLATVTGIVLAASAAFAWLPPQVRLSALDAACRARLGSACLAAGRNVQQAVGTRDRARPLAYFARGCELGHGTSCRMLGHAQLARGAAGQRQAADAFGRACTAGDTQGCNGLAAMYEAGLGVARDPARAAQLYAQACERNDGYGCLRLSDAHARGQGVRRDAQRAAALALRSCEAGERRGCTLRAAALASGTGVKRDVPNAIEFYWRACGDGGNEPVACGELGARHLRGDGVQKDVKRAAYFYLTVACTHGHGPSCRTAGELFERSTDVGIDLPRAAGLYERGCALRDAASCLNLGVMFAEGRGRQRDLARAVSLYDTACRLGMRQVCGLAAQVRAAVPGAPSPR